MSPISFLLPVIAFGIFTILFFWLTYSKKPFIFHTRYFLIILVLNLAPALYTDFAHSILHPIIEQRFRFTLAANYSAVMALILLYLIFQIIFLKSYTILGVAKDNFNDAMNCALTKAELNTTTIQSHVRSVVRLKIDSSTEQIQYNKNVWGNMTEIRVIKAKDNIVINKLLTYIRQYFAENECKLPNKNYNLYRMLGLFFGAISCLILAIEWLK